MGLLGSFRKRSRKKPLLEVIEQAGNLARLGRYVEAIEAYKEATELAPEEVYARHRVGEIYSELGMHYEAIEVYKQAVHITPDDEIGHQGLAKAYANMGR